MGRSVVRYDIVHVWRAAGLHGEGVDRAEVCLVYLSPPNWPAFQCIVRCRVRSGERMEIRHVPVHGALSESLLIAATSSSYIGDDRSSRMLCSSSRSEVLERLTDAVSFSALRYQSLL